ncbi:class I SAM-dependent methyltransferase [Ramlibacter sp. PS4R-6]|uniref:class I SAM-dependent methyltransferase n=1 Tax=Ramlibacter sp. PS4R-6 TaxID=3133438 RepID=UPI0030AEA6D3
MSEPVFVEWAEGGQPQRARWRSEAGVPPPVRLRAVDDTLTADEAVRLASEGTGLVWRSDYHNARQLLQAMARRMERKRKPAKPAGSITERFHQHRQQQGQRARILGRVLVPLDGDWRIPLHRAPDVRLACAEAWGPADGTPSLVALRELLGVIGAHEWRTKGVEIPALGARIHPHYGVFSPVRGEYVDLVAQAPLPHLDLAFDVGTGTGVIAALLAKRGVKRVVATDVDERALACARDNIARLGLAKQVDVVRADLFPEGPAPLIVCNPPWLPGRASAPLERAIYDEDSRMTRAFLAGLRAHLAPGGEGWLVMSDFAEHLGLRAPGELASWIEAAGLRVMARDDTRPRHPKAVDADDPLHDARARETTSLWRLAAQR